MPELTKTVLNKEALVETLMAEIKHIAANIQETGSGEDIRAYAVAQMHIIETAIKCGLLKE